ncbi:MAG: hypothetical protein SGJ20_17555 [Planctomycetota bacterium]|nr:hypothetical protein [Planctomycetota bacterium]
MKSVHTPQSRCRAGIVSRDITPPVGIYHRMWGAAVHDRSEGVHRPLMATVLCLLPEVPVASKISTNGKGASLIGAAVGDALIVVALDHCLMDASDVTQIRHAVSTELHTHAENVQVIMSHTHGSGYMFCGRADLPGGDLIGPYLDAMTAQCAKFAKEALQSAGKATIVYGTGRCALAKHRDYWDEDAQSFVVSFNPEGPADDTLLVGRIESESGKTLGTIVNYACHPTTLAWDNRLLSPDFIGSMRELIEQHTGAPAMFIQGASGDLGPQQGFIGDTTVADKNGRELGFAALATLEGIPAAGQVYQYTGWKMSGTRIGEWRYVPQEACALEPQAEWRSSHQFVPLPYREDMPTPQQARADYHASRSEEEQALAAGDQARHAAARIRTEQLSRLADRLEGLPVGKDYPYPVDLQRIGEAVWLFVPGELYQDFQVELRAAFPAIPLIIATMSGSWNPAYLPKASSYGYGIYQDTCAVVAPGSLEQLIEAVKDQITELVNVSQAAELSG